MLTHVFVLSCRVHQLISSGENEVYLHALGAAIPRALNLALKVKKNYGDRVTLDTATNTVELTDDFERVTAAEESTAGGSGSQRSRLNSGVYVKIVFVPAPAEGAAGSNTSSSTDTSEQ